MHGLSLVARTGSLFVAMVAMLAIVLPALAQTGPLPGPTPAAQPGAPVERLGPPVRPAGSTQPPAPAQPSATEPADEAADSSEFTPFWVAAYRPTSLWSAQGPDGEPLGSPPVQSPLQVLRPQGGSRLHVFDPVSGATAWIDATAVGPIGTPSATDLLALTASPAAPAFEPFWVMTDQPATLWSGADSGATALAPVRQWRYFQVVQPTEGTRASVFDPRTRVTGWLDRNKVGPVGAPPAEYSQRPPPDDVTLNLPARISGPTALYDYPVQANHFALDRITTNESIIVIGALSRPDGNWYHLDSGEYAPAARVRLPDPPPQTFAGRWIDASLTEPVIVTAYEGNTPVYAALAVKGTTAFATPTGVFRILRRVADETMNSETLIPPIPRNAPGGYYFDHVLDTQYFTGDGASIHYNYWYANWGYAGSHGCLGMNRTDARFFWNFASIDTTVSIHN